MKVVVVDYGSGNLTSAAKAVERAASERGVAADVIVSGDAKIVAAADRLVVPGQGAFADCRAGLLAVPGLFEAVQDVAITKARPFFGICVGMQLMCEAGLEFGTHPGFGWINGQCEKFDLPPQFKIPHMGWNELTVTQADHAVLKDVASGEHVYFVHSYHLTDVPAAQVLATSDYGGSVVAIVGRDNLVGTQFHVEKSQATGIKLLGNFLEWTP